MGGRTIPARRVVAVAVAVILLLAPAVRAATLTVVNKDGVGEGFNDPTSVSPVGGNTGTTLGEQRLIAFQYAADLWGARIASNRTIMVDATFDPLFCESTSAVLGQAGGTTLHGNFLGAPRNNTWYLVALANVLSGQDLNGAGTAEIRAQFNSSLDTGCFSGGGFYYGLDGQQGTDSDFVTVLLHELGHGLGFVTGVDLFTGAKQLGFDDAYMVHLEDHSTGKKFPNMTDAERLVAMTDGSQTTSDLKWTGSAVVAAAAGLSAGVGAGGHVEMYAPNPAEPGSSVSHFAKTLSPNELMEPAFTSPLHELELTLELFEDLGYPATIACGDANRDGNVSATDALFALKTAVGSASCVETLCDATNDGKVSATDALRLLKAAVGQVSSMRCGLRTS